jgi:hypothetical protein
MRFGRKAGTTMLRRDLCLASWLTTRPSPSTGRAKTVSERFFT